MHYSAHSRSLVCERQKSASDKQFWGDEKLTNPRLNDASEKLVPSDGNLCMRNRDRQRFSIFAKALFL
jgi:hypothetical protein